MRCILFNKPYRVLSKFTDAEGRTTLAEFVRESRLYPAGRLDYDSEGLLLLTDHGPAQARITDPRSHLSKTYLAQVEGTVTPSATQRLQAGLVLNDGPARALSAEAIERPGWLWEREPPIRYRARIPTGWLRIVLDEGRNRQVRRMTAAVGLPTLRLIRTSIGPWTLAGLSPGQWRELDPLEVEKTLFPRKRRARGLVGGR
jgi:23S rRNA pseudouridine2457 synthase